MSTKINVSCEIRDSLILKDTLKQMGINFSENNAGIITMKLAYGVEIDPNSGKLSYDSSDTTRINNIQQTYTANFYRDKAIREGNQVKEETLANGEIRINILN